MSALPRGGGLFRVRWLWAGLLVQVAWGQTTRPVAPPRFEVRFDAAVSDRAYSGRVYVILTTSPAGEPRRGVGWFSREPIFSQEAADWKPGETLTIEAARALGYPHGLEELPAGRYRAQAVIDLNGWSHEVINAPGNAYSEPVPFEHGGTEPATVRLSISNAIPRPELKDSETHKYVRLRSELLSAFHGRDVYLQAAVGLPRAYLSAPERRFPALYVVSGFGATMQHARLLTRTTPYTRAGLDIVVIYIDADCPTGHHVWADSANNGPWGTALTTELIPHLEGTFRLIPETNARYVTGHSSGGWSSLWLQVAYPDVFGGCWSTSPDPVDFTAFQTINIYDASENMYTQADGSPRPVSREMGGGVRLLAREFDRLESVLGRGGQLQSFEAVFSPRGADGRPAPLWSRTTGALDPEVAQAWRKYDIREVLETNWASLGPKLKGKLYLFCGDADTFYLERAFFKLRDALERLGSDAYVEVIPGASHGLPPSVGQKIARQMAEHFRARYPEAGGR